MEIWVEFKIDFHLNIGQHMDSRNVVNRLIPKKTIRLAFQSECLILLLKMSLVYLSSVTNSSSLTLENPRISSTNNSDSNPIVPGLFDDVEISAFGSVIV